jgi:hypothetical protein
MFGSKAAEDFEHGRGPVGVEVRGRFVQHQDAGSRGQDTSQGQPLLLATGQLVPAPPFRARQADLLKNLADPDPHLVARPRSVLEPERNVVRDALHDELAASVLEDDADLRRDLGSCGRGGVEVTHGQLTPEIARDLARDQPRDGQPEGALARAGAADDQQRLAGGQLEGYVAQGRPF